MSERSSPVSAGDPEATYHFEIWQGGVLVACGSGPDLDECGLEMVRYAAQYVQDGPIIIRGSPELASHGYAARDGEAANAKSENADNA